MADTIVINWFENVLQGQVVTEALDAALEEHKRQQQDPAPLRREADQLRAEVARLVDSLAKGGLQDMHDAIRARRSRLEQVDAELAGIKAAEGFNMAKFTEKIGPLLKEWRARLHTPSAQQVLHKLLPTRLKITPKQSPDGRPMGWAVDGQVNYEPILRELGLSAV